MEQKKTRKRRDNIIESNDIKQHSVGVSHLKKLIGH